MMLLVELGGGRGAAPLRHDLPLQHLGLVDENLDRLQTDSGL